MIFSRGFVTASKRRAWIVAALAGALGAAAAVAERYGGAAPAANAPVPVAPAATLSLTFGVRDTAPRAWNGRLDANPAEAWIEADRFRVHETTEATFSAAGAGTVARTETRFPNDYTPDAVSWVASTREASMHGPTTEWNIRPGKPAPILQQPSILVHLSSAAARKPLRITTAGGELTLDLERLQCFRPALQLEGQVRVERVPAAFAVAPERLGQQDFPSILATRSGTFWVAWQEFDDQADSVYARRRAGAGWGAPELLVQGADVFRTELVEDARGRVWVIWAQQVSGDWDLYGRAHDGGQWSPVERLTRGAGPDLYHRAVSDGRGRVWLVWQHMDGPSSSIRARSFDGARWTDETTVSDARAPGNNWWPAVAASGDNVAVAWDGYASGNYDIYLRRFDGTRWGPVRAVAATSRFEAHPSIAADPGGRIWIAWDESGTEWGKDTGFLVVRKGTQLHESRSIRVVALEGDQVRTTRLPLQAALEPGEFWELPHLALDGSGRPWLFARRLLMRQPDTPLEGPIDLALWDIWVTRADGGGWAAPMKLPRSAGRNEMMPATTRDGSGRLWVAWATDLRSTGSFLPQQLRVEAAELPDQAPAGLPELVPFAPEPVTAEAIHPGEAEHVRRIRDYRIESRGKRYAIYRGDLHRHTEFSSDGLNDGSLLDAYRYARDAAALDFLGISDHTGFVDEPATWWLSQKTADLFQVDGGFVAFQGYERSLEYPNGHRNVFFVRRGAAITPISSTEGRGWEGAGRLHWYLRRVGGISIPHTSGRTSGTDWRDNDPAVEPLVEIYQGMRDTYEHPGAPRPKRLGREFIDPSGPVPRASSSERSPSFRPLGFVWNALAKGYRLGFIASSDHISGHVSYACVMAERLSRESLFEAMRARRTYGATDNIVLDVRFVAAGGAEHLMGEEFASADPVRVQVRVLGTGPIERVEVIKDGRIVFSQEPAGSEAQFEYADEASSSGQSYYYVRVMQRDGEMAWGSPAWVDYRAAARGTNR